MLKFLGFLLKASVVALLIVLVGNWLRWDGKPVNDQIRTHLSHAETSEVFHGIQNKAKSWSKGIRPSLSPDRSNDDLDDQDAHHDRLHGERHAKPQPKGGGDKLSATARLNPADRKPASGETPSGVTDEHLPSEKQKLRALISEMNQSH